MRFTSSAPAPPRGEARCFALGILASDQLRAVDASSPLPSPPAPRVDRGTIFNTLKSTNTFSFFPLQAQHSPRSRCKPTKSARLGSNTSPQPKTHVFHSVSRAWVSAKLGSNASPQQKTHGPTPAPTPDAEKRGLTRSGSTLRRRTCSGVQAWQRAGSRLDNRTTVDSNG